MATESQDQRPFRREVAMTLRSLWGGEVVVDGSAVLMKPSL